MDLWAACGERARVEPLNHELLRVVESQEQIATNRLVDDLQEQHWLEAMVERTKPPLPDSARSLHYLLATPFRYPPLRHGSRFGTYHEPSLFYGSHTLATALAETAYYRFVFWHGMREPPPSGKYLTQHTVFAVRYQTGHGLRLQDPPCNRYQAVLTDPQSYHATQSLGAAMRAARIEAFEYVSARDPDGGINAALFTPAALAVDAPLYQQPWICESRAETVSFYSVGGEGVHAYPIALFMVDETLPSPPA